MVKPSHDLYLALIDYDIDANTVRIKAYMNPLVMWIWISCAFFTLGTALSLLPDRKREAAAEAVAVPSPARDKPLGAGSATRPEVLATTAQSKRSAHKEAVQ
jgi:hypothetical protein